MNGEAKFIAVHCELIADEIPKIQHILWFSLGPFLPYSGTGLWSWMYTPFMQSRVFPGIQMLLCHERSDPHNSRHQILCFC